MAVFGSKRTSSISAEDQPRKLDEEKLPYEYQQYGAESPVTEVGVLSDPKDSHHSLHRGLSARQVSMIAIGGAIGTGLIIGTGSALANTGPASILISYTIVGMLVYVVMAALGEMATWLPAAGGFAVYATRFVDPALGFSLGYTYWFKYIITTPNQLTAAALVIQYWLPADQVNPGVWIAVFLVVIITINVLGIKYFGELEFWLSSIKVLVIIGLIILSLIIALGGADGDRRGFRYWSDPGAFKEYVGKGATGRFTAVWQSMVTAVFAYLGTELVGVTVGEAQNPRKNIPRAIKLTFWRIAIFYVVSVILLGMIVPYNSDQLAFATKSSTSAAASPFVVAIKLAGIDVLPGFINGCILIFVFSASNSDLYIASRTLHGLALKRHAPEFLAITNKRGVPYYALGLSSLICCIAFMNVSTSSKTVFGYFVNLVSIFGLLTWISILVSHIYFVKARRAQGVPDNSSQLRYKSPFGLWGSYVALAFCCLIALTKNFTVFVPKPSTYGNFDYKNFITGYLGIPLYLIMIVGYKFVKKTHGVKPHEADLWTDKDVIDADEQEWLAKEAADRANGRDGSWLYRHSIGYIF
ncbi:Dicarboxylic amino acid permease [Pseudocercospora fuligena]|uniref:Dicarboxylic amino acid permease n=1 Tax=Pseudocercospora fuligena TaxID=685502 RepID=A0A8H6VI06_9PEZI|nr:Dicarboxylic amino acid permease [Pseudocercospora fuligena]